MDSDDFIQASSFRRNAILGLALSALVILTPFALNNFVQGRPILGVGSLLIVVILAFNAWSLTSGRYSSLPTLVGLVPALLFFLGLSIARQGMIGILWCFPATLAVYFMLPERRAWIANALMLAIIIPESWLLLDHPIAMRVWATLVAVSIFSMIFVRAIINQQSQLRRMATTDVLTGLLNRATLDVVLEQAITQCNRSGTPMTLAALDLDHFKKINDNWGHHVGDDVLRSVGELLRSRLRRSDTIFRLGGEEFLALLFDTDADDAQEVAEALRRTFEEHAFPGPGKVTTSIGLATLGKDETADGWMQRADKHLYEAKSAGRNRVCPEP